MAGTFEGLKGLWAGSMLLLWIGCGRGVFYLPVERGDEGRTAPPLVLRWSRSLGGPPMGGALLNGGLVLQLTTRSTLQAFDRCTGQRLGRKGFEVPSCVPPVLVGDCLVLALLGRRPELQAFDCRTQEIRWTYRGVFCAPLTASGDTLLAAGGDGLLRALAAGNGQEFWRTAVGRPLQTAPSRAGSAIYTSDGGNGLVALAADSGWEQWRQRLGSRVRTRPLVAEGRVVVGLAAGTLVALEALTGQLLWQTDLGSRPASGIALGGQILVVGAGDGRLSGVALESGRVQWTFATQGPVRGAPAVVGQTVYCGSSDGRLYALDLDSGRLQWDYLLDGPVLVDVAADQGLVAIASEKGTLYAFAGK